MTARQALKAAPSDELTSGLQRWSVFCQLVDEYKEDRAPYSEGISTRHTQNEDWHAIMI